MEIVGLKQKVDNDINKLIIKFVGMKTHPIAHTIKESFQNDGDIIGFDKSYFIKCCRKGWSDLFQLSDRTEEYWDWNLFIDNYNRL